ncbi:MAG: hypothetical protein HYS04_00530 [Acidobacteria bacterium]|nr:hypothetical protein [Acidobacteriota bacterium]
MPLWILFIAVQLLDVFWGIFVLLGVERVRIVPGFTKTNALDLYYMPYTHSLPGALGWALVAGVAYLAASRSRRGGLLVGAAVFSHWPLDLLVHRPDLALYDNAAKVGLGLWDYPLVTLVIESALVLGGLGLCIANTRALKGSARYAMPLFICAALGLQAAMAFGPPPPSDDAMAVTALASYAILAGAIAWLEKAGVPGAKPNEPERPNGYSL